MDLQVDDVEAYLEAREIAAAVDAPGVMEYWKSTPYLLSFMDRYQLSERVLATVQKELMGRSRSLSGAVQAFSYPAKLWHKEIQLTGETVDACFLGRYR